MCLPSTKGCIAFLCQESRKEQLSEFSSLTFHGSGLSVWRSLLLLDQSVSLL